MEVLKILVICGLFLFNAGLALLEAARSRSKNVATTITKHTTCFLLSCIAFWLCGYGIAFGGGNTFAGSTYFVLNNVSTANYSDFIVHSLLSNIPHSIVSGAVAERSHFTGHLLMSLVISGVIYPVVLHWFIHPEGWMHSYGIADLGLSTSIHVLSGSLAFVACIIVGRREEKIGTKFSVNIPGHSLPLAYIGSVFIVIGMLSKNIYFELTTENELGKLLVNAHLAAAASGIFSILLYKIGVIGQNEYELKNSNQTTALMLQSRKWSFYAVMNGCIAGLVSISGGGSIFPNWAAFVIGLVTGVLYFICSQLVKLARIDDSTDVIATHFIPGICGAVSPYIVSMQENNGGWSMVGCLAAIGWGLATCSVLYLIIFVLQKRRVSPNIEKLGSDAHKIDEQAYSSFCTEQNPQNKTYQRFESPGVPVIFGEKRGTLRCQPSRSASCTAVVSPLGPTMTSTHKNLGLELQHLSKSVPKIIVEEEYGNIKPLPSSQIPQPPPPPPYKPVANSFTSKEEYGNIKPLPSSQIPQPPPPPPYKPVTSKLPSPTIDISYIPPPPPVPPSSPWMGDMENNSNNVKLDFEKLRVTLKQQKKRLRQTGLIDNVSLNSSVISLNDSQLDTNSEVIKEIKSNGSNFNYLSPSFVPSFNGINYKRPLQNEILASWNRRRSFDDDMMNTETETIEITVNESVATGITSSEYQDDVTCEFASSQMNSQNDIDSGSESDEVDPNNNNNNNNNDDSYIKGNMKMVGKELSINNIESHV